MKTRKGTNMVMNAMIIAAIVACAYYFLGKKYFAPIIDQYFGDKKTGSTGKGGISAPNPFSGVQGTTDTYNKKVAEEEKARNEAIGALSGK
jgi:hypothetical protein